jgi:long-chain acyl-CoA synthetase
MMLELIAYHAGRAPNDLAIYESGREMSYAETLVALNRLIAALSELPLRQGQLVGVACQIDYLHLMMMFALEALGVVGLPFAQPTDPGIEKALRHCDLILAPKPPAVARPYFEVSPEWLRDILAGHGPVPAALPVVEAPGYVLTTSGTTGAAKAMRLAASALTLRENDRIWQYGLSRTSRFAVAMPIIVGGIYSTARACLRARGCLIFPSGLLPEITLPFTTHILLLPIHVRNLLELLPRGYVPKHPLMLISMGARLPAALRSSAVARLGAVIHDGYGANETGPIAVVNVDGVGHILPGVDIKIVDQTGNMVPFGDVGIIRARSHSQITGYLESAHNAQYLREGWFDTGDIGRQPSSRLLQVIGRPDAMLNIGGLKVAAEEIEDLLIQAQIARDAAVCGIAFNGGIAEIYLALEDPLGSDAEIMAAAGKHIGSNLGRIHIVRISKVPRGAAGKILRAEVARLIESTMAPSS